MSGIKFSKEGFINAVDTGEFDSSFTLLYGIKQEALPEERCRYLDAMVAFEEAFGGNQREYFVFSAPGRTEICGNHTDHNNGRVLAAAVDLDIIAIASPNNENMIRVQSAGFNRTDAVDLSDLSVNQERKGNARSLMAGVAAGIRARGGSVSGVDIYTTSRVSRGSGLSSSAAFEVCLGTALNCIFNDGRLSPLEIAQIGQYAENEHYGKPCGLMDQTACAVGGAVEFDFENPQNPAVTKLDFNLAKHGYSMVITNTGGSHSDMDGEYAAIRAEMESIAVHFGKITLRGVTEASVLTELPRLREEAGDRAVLRALHYFAENQRVVKMTAAIKSGDVDSFLHLVRDSGHSSYEYVQNAYNPNDPRQQGIPVALALSGRILGRRGAARLQGGGFAGTIQAFVPEDLLVSYCELLQSVFGKDACTVVKIRDHGGVMLPVE